MLGGRLLNKNIFRKYDIRGIVEKDLHYDDAILIGMAIGTILSKKGIYSACVGRDGRLSSQKLSDNLISGIIKCGISVIDIGLVPTPCLYFGVYHLNLNAGIMVTGSHNPKDYNGFKIMIRDEAFFGEKVQEINQICESEDFLYSGNNAKIIKQDITENYINEITSFLHIQEDLNICIDAGNGAGGEIAQRIAKKLNIKNDKLLYCKIDGNFPNHHPDPTIEKNMIELGELVKKNNSHFGIGLDGDADRIGIVDDKGRFVYGDTLLCILAKFLLKKQPGATIIADVKTSKVLFDEIKNLGGIGIMWQTGHSLIKDKMKKTGALLAGEMSGHIFYKHEYYGYDDGIFAGMKLIEIIQNNDIKISDLIDMLPKTFSTPETKIEIDESIKFKIMDEICQYLKTKYSDYIDIDGIRINFSFGWLLIRASNTQSCLVARCEADNENNLLQLKTILTETLKKFNITL